VGQKVNPKGFRVGVYRDWDAHWFARDSYGKQVLEDIKLRKLIDSLLGVAFGISRVVIERDGKDRLRIELHTSSPGIVIGRKGQEIDALRKKLGQATICKDVEVSVQEIQAPELDALLVAKNIAAQLEKRVGFKQAMKKAMAATIRAGARGVKILCSGRLGGAEIARSEGTRSGSVPLHTLRADIDYGLAEAKTTYGIIGVKVWVCRGEYH